MEPSAAPPDRRADSSFSHRRSGLALGIDMGGTGIKAALVDLATGQLATERVRAKTPHPATWRASTQVIRDVVGEVLDGQDVPSDLPIGCGLPGVVKDGRLLTYANIDPDWATVSARDVVGEALRRPVIVLNDADAAGIAEVAWGAAEGHPGTVLLIAIGTGIGSALFTDGHLVPNTEFGHFEFKGKAAETRVSGVARERRGLGWRQWAVEFNEYLERVEHYVSPDLIVLGGGVSKAYEKFDQHLQTRAPRVPARLLNSAGIAGAALMAADHAAST